MPDLGQASGLTTAAGVVVHCQKILSEDGKKVCLYCHSEAPGQKEQAIVQAFSTRFETASNKSYEGLQSPCCEKRPDKLWHL